MLQVAPPSGQVKQWDILYAHKMHLYLGEVWGQVLNTPVEPEAYATSASPAYVSFEHEDIHSVIAVVEPLHRKYKSVAHVLHFVESAPTEHYPFAQVTSHLMLK